MRKIALLFSAATVLAVGSYAGAFQLNLQGVRQMSMAGSGVAVPWDASAMFYNPGALARLHSFDVSGNLFLTFPRIKYLQAPTGGYSYESVPNTGTPFSAYIGGNIPGSKLAVGVGVYTPFGNSLSWDENWTGRYLVQSISLSSVFIQPTISYELDEFISVGGGFIYAVGGVDITKAIPITDQMGNDGQAKLNGKAQGVGFNLGAHIRASKSVQIGLSYRSGVKMRVKDGDASFAVAQSVQAGFPGATKFKSDLNLPGILTGGVGIQPNDALTLQGDLVVAFWNVYDSLKIDFADNTPLLQDIADPRDYRATLALRVGANYEATDWLDVMVGGAFDPTPTRNNLVSPDAVDADRITASCGVALKPVQGLTVSAGLTYTHTMKREASYEPAGFNGAYKILSLTPAIGLSFQF